MAQHPESFEDIEELDEDDKVPIRQEKSRKLSMAIHDYNSKLKSRQMAFALGIILYRRYLLTWLSYPVRLYLKKVNAIISLTLHRGWDNTGANGANLSFPQEFGIEHNTWLVGFVNAA